MKYNNKKRRLGEKSLMILKAIGDEMVEFVNIMTTLPPDQYAVGAVRIRNRRYYQRTYNLYKSGYIKIQKKQNRSFFSLTPKGKLEFLKYLHLEKIFKQKWDGRWRVIIFDIPEKLKKLREYMRAELKYLKFQPLQESVYITPYPVTGELNTLLKKQNLKKYFRYLTVTEIDGEEELKKLFGL